MDQMLYLFSGLRWQDVLDIVLNTYILFRFYVLFRGTNVIRVLLAVGVLWVISRAAVPLGLVITSWAMQGVITVAAFIIIIVFRNEISSVLQIRDIKSFFWGIPRYQTNTPLNLIAQSVQDLAVKRIGALIILPLKKGMENVVEGGTALDSVLSKEMLVSIFWPNNPLHDGAVVIEGNRITRAGAILPLSHRQDIPSAFGTRHRAALGVSELTDAVVIVVSEETGRITLFKEDQIYEIPDKGELDRLLELHATDEDNKKGFFRQAFELPFAALVCLICITGLWMNFSKGLETLANYQVPVEFLMPDQKMEIISSSVSDVKLLVSGSRPLINSITTEQLNVKVDLSDTRPGKNHLVISKKNIGLPPGIRLKSIEPSQLDITVDYLVEKELPVQPNWSGKLADGLILVQAKVVPESIRVVGTKLALSEISTLFTATIPLETIKKSGTIEVDLALESPALKHAGVPTVKIEYTIRKKKK